MSGNINTVSNCRFNFFLAKVFAAFDLTGLIYRLKPPLSDENTLKKIVQAKIVEKKILCTYPG